MKKIESLTQTNEGSSTFKEQDFLSHQYFLEENGYKVKSLIGWGSLGPLMLADKINTKEKVAIKQFYVETDEDLGNIFQLFYSLSLLKSPYSVNLISLLPDIVSQYVYLVMEYFPNGNLGEYIKKSKQLSSAQISEIISLIIKGLIFLKENNMSHGNLKLSNILIGPNGSPILTGFGVAHLTSKSSMLKENQKRKQQLYWTEKQNTLEQQPIFHSDYQAVGMILWALCGNNDISEISDVQIGKFPDISQRNHQEYLKLAFEMIVQDTTTNNPPLEAILSQLEKLLDPSQQTNLYQDQRKQYQFEMHLKMNSVLSFKFMKQFPESLLEKYNHLSHLSLDFKQSLIGDTEATSLLSPLRHFLNLSKLELNLNKNSIGAVGAHHLLLPLSNSINLVSFSLDLSKNSIGEIGAQSLLLPLKNLVNLEIFKLNLYDNYIGAIGAQSLLSPLSNLLNLQSLSLDLYNNTIQDDGAQTLLLPIANLVNLSFLYLILISNNIGDKGALFLLLPLKELINLSTLHLDLYLNSIEYTGAQNLLLPIADLINLRKISLNLYRSKIGADGASSLLIPLSKLTNLQVLSLSLVNCSIGDNGTQLLLLSIVDLINLSSIFLDLSSNQITDNAFQSLLYPLMSLQKIVNLSITATNNLLNKESQHIFKTMFKQATISIELEDSFFF